MVNLFKLCYLNGQKTESLYTTAPFEKNNDLEQELKENLEDKNSFNNSMTNIKELVTYFKQKNKKSKQKYKKKLTTK